MCKIYIVSHPHNEPSYSRKRPVSSVVIGWNTSTSHKRKFIKRKGQYLKNSKVIDSDIFFWGEYEAGSGCTVLSMARPKAIHDTLVPARGVSRLPAGAMNTDPYVFGNHFKHICCGMRWTGGNYESGDVILFGHVSYVDGRYLMALDTVLVVKDRVNVDFKRNCTQYYKAGIEPTNKNVFYRGVPYSSETKYFSFVPCKTEYSNHPLPVLDLGSMGFSVGKTFRSWTSDPIPFTHKIWQTIIDKVHSEGWELGVHVDKI